MKQSCQDYRKDLLWALESPVLLGESVGIPLVTDRDCQNWLQKVRPYLDQKQEKSSLKSSRLGDYFASLIDTLLRMHPDLQDVHEGIQVIEEGLTVGEFDFLFRDDIGSLHHWEVAVKFYLQMDPEGSLAGYVGPGGRDFLLTKLNHLRNHQMLLGDLPCGQQVWQAMAKGPLEKKLLMKGTLFYPWGKPLPKIPEELSTYHEKKWWIREGGENWERFDQEKSRLEARWVVLPKHRWLSRFETRDDKQLLNFQGVCGNDRAVLAAQVSQNEEGVWVEQDRGFILPNDSQ